MKKIAIISGSRAEFDLLLPLAKAIRASKNFELQFILTGPNVSSGTGVITQELANNDIQVADQIDVILASGNSSAIVKAVGLSAIGFVDSFRRLAPDLVILLGDRFEIFGAAQAAAFARIPIAHIHGGETSEGAFDEFIRHSITKMSQLHFVANEDYRRRVIQLGESPDRVFTVGAPGIDNIANQTFLSVSEISKSIGFDLVKDYFLFTYHPETFGDLDPILSLQFALGALSHFFPQYQALITYPNSDARSQEMITTIEKFRGDFPNSVCLVPTLGKIRYLSAMKHCRAVVGNSSSGIIEAPFLKVPTVNIGIRQQGRMKAASIVDSLPDKESIVHAIGSALSLDAKIREASVSVYGDGFATEKIFRILSGQSEIAVRKKFFDIVSP